jgi:excinuclease ABC subunit C
MEPAFQSEELKKQLSGVPKSPGVYLFKNEQAEIIYIGKAVSLRQRVRSYFNDNAWRERPKLAVMMPKVGSLDFIITNGEKEALLLEANLVRQHMPRYNVALKDDKRYPWLAITYDTPFPRLVMIRDPSKFRKDNPKAKVFGPYVEAGKMWETVRVLRKVFPMRQRKRPLFKDRPCMNYHLGLCLGPCQNLVTDFDYDKMVKQVEMFLAGRQSEVIAQLKIEMAEYSQDLNYEQAAKVRDKLSALSTMVEQQQVFFINQKVSQDVLASADNGKLIAICLMKIREGKLISSEVITLPLTDKTSAGEAWQSFIDQYYTNCDDITIPKQILLEADIEDKEALAEHLSDRSKFVVQFSVPQRGEKQRVIVMAKKNAEAALEKEAHLNAPIEIDSRELKLLEELKTGIGLRKLPRRIECFDISNIQGTDNVASMVVFENGHPKKSDYRLFKIQSVEGEANDFASMNEVVRRRYSRILSEQKSFPDLIIIDGGRGQLNAALEALKELRISDQDIIGLAKKQEEIYLPDNPRPVLLSRRSQALHTLQHARDEAHRFAITYHRKKRAKRVLRSEFDDLPGIGPVRRKALINHFGSLEKLKGSSLSEIAAVPGFSKALAEKISTVLAAGDASNEQP